MIAGSDTINNGNYIAQINAATPWNGFTVAWCNELPVNRGAVAMTVFLTV
jgi:hypothetical protein